MPGAWEPILTMTYGMLQRLATGRKNSHLDSPFRVGYGCNAAFWAVEYYTSMTGVIVKRAFGIVLVLAALSLPLWASSPLRDEDRHKKKTVVSGATMLAGLMLARKQRATQATSVNS